MPDRVRVDLIWDHASRQVACWSTYWITQRTHVPVSARWGEVFGDDVVAAAMIDRLVHHAEVIGLKGDSYRLRTETWAAFPKRPLQPKTDRQPTSRGSTFNRRKGVRFQLSLTTDSAADIAANSGQLNGHETWAERLGNGNRTSTHKRAPLEAFAIEAEANGMINVGVVTAQNLRSAADDTDELARVRKARLKVPCQGPGGT